jgi:hypothetical protein
MLFSMLGETVLNRPQLAQFKPDAPTSNRTHSLPSSAPSLIGWFLCGLGLLRQLLVNVQAPSH